MRTLKVFVILAALMSIVGCNTDQSNPRDPWDNINRPFRLDHYKEAYYAKVVKTIKSTDATTGITISKVVVKDSRGYFLAVVQPAGIAEIPDGTKVEVMDMMYWTGGGDHDIAYQNVLVPTK
jgi:hypothetical protein